MRGVGSDFFAAAAPPPCPFWAAAGTEVTNTRETIAIEAAVITKEAITARFMLNLSS
jgi:hypothetical protein